MRRCLELREPAALARLEDTEVSLDEAKAPLLGAWKTEDAFEQVEWGAWSQAALVGLQQCALARRC